MIVNIEGRDYNLIFGWDFLEEINKRIGINQGALQLEQGGVIRLESAFMTKDPVTLIHIIQSATETERQKPSKKGIQKLIEGLLIEGTYSEFYEELEEDIKKQPLLNSLIKVNFGTQEEVTKEEK